MLLRKFEMPWRPTYEAYAAAVWLMCIGTLVYRHSATDLPTAPFQVLVGLSFVFLIVNGLKTLEVWQLKFNLGGKGISFVTDLEVRKRALEHPDALWIGRGFDWTPIHTQRLHELKRRDPREFYPPRAIMHALEWTTGEKVGANSPDGIGAPWIHGLEPVEKDLYVAIQNLIGNTLILGTTRCGKTRMLELIAEIAINLGYTVILFDPKGDQALEASCKAACHGANRDGDYVRFHLAFPNHSVRIDPLKNYTNPSDLASRISALMPGGDGSQSFRDFGWGVLNAIILGMLDLGEKPTLVGIRSYVDTGIEDLLMRVLLRHFDDRLSKDWEAEVAAYAKTLKVAKGRAGDDGEVLVRQSLNLLCSYYANVLIPLGHTHEAIQALMTIYKHDSAHYTKMIATLLPIMGMLTTGELGGLLSPDAMNLADERPMTDLQALIRSKAVVYVGLDSLANKAISTAVGSMLLSDLTSVAASIYNFASDLQATDRIFLLVDEAAEVVNDPYIAMLNKSAGAGFVNFATAQTIPDLAARFESMDKARMMLGNFNNLFAMRIKDRVTQDFVTETFGETYVHLKQEILGTTSSTEANITHFNGSVQERVTETMNDLMPTDVLGQLPNWQYVASVSGGTIKKGRLPIIRHEASQEVQ